MEPVWSPGELELLGNTFLFRGVERAAVLRAASDPRCSRESFTRGAQIYSPRRFRRSLGVILAGRVRVTKGELVVSTLGFAFAPQLIALFRDDPGVIAIGTVALRFQCVTFFFQAWITMSNMMLQTIGRTVPATFVAMARQGIFFIPLVWLLSLSPLGLLGVQMAQSVSDLLTLAAAVPIQLYVLRQMSQMQPAKV